MHKAHVSAHKKQEVKQLEDLIKKYKSFGIIDLTGLPSASMQSLRSKLKPGAVIRTTKKSLIKIAINNLKDQKQNIESLLPPLENSMPALVFTNDNPFKISNQINKNKTPAPAKPGQISPKDIIVQAGPTSFVPGPIIGELAQVGIKTAIEGGKLAIKEDVTLVKKGQEISKKVSETLAKLSIMPMEIGINLVCIYEEGKIYHSDVLSITQDVYLEMLKQAYVDSLGLAVQIGYTTKETVTTLISKSVLEAKALAIKTQTETDFLPHKKQETQNQETKELKTQTHNEPKEHKQDHAPKHRDDDKKPHDFLGYSKQAVDKAQEILKDLQDKKIEEHRT